MKAVAREQAAALDKWLTPRFPKNRSCWVPQLEYSKVLPRTDAHLTENDNALGRFTAAPSKRFLLFLILLAVGVRLLNIWLLSGDPVQFQVEDSGEYLRGRNDWIRTGSFVGFLDGVVVIPPERMPGYFWFLASVQSIFGPSVIAIAAVQAVIDAVNCILIAVLAAQLWMPASRIAGLSAALWPNLIIHSGIVVQETLFLLFVIGWMLAMVFFARKPGIRRALLAGLLFGVALFFRAAMQFMILILPLIVFYFTVRCSRDHRWGRGLAAAMVFIIAALIPVSPVLYRNISNFGAPALTAQTGLHALFWTLSLVRMDQNGTTFDVEAKKTQVKFAASLKARGIDASTLNPFEIDRLRRNMAIEELLNVSVTRLLKVWVQGAAISLFSPSVLSHGRVRALPRPSFYQTSGNNLVERARDYLFNDPGLFQVIVILALAASIISVIFQLLGLWRLFRLSRIAFFSSVLYVGYFLALSGPTAGPKYRMPYEPIMIILFALGLGGLFLRRQSARDGNRQIGVSS